MIRVAFTLIGDRSGTGGYNYLLNLMRLLGQYQADAIGSVLFAGDDAPSEDLAPFNRIEGVQIVRDRSFDLRRKARSQLRAVVFGSDVTIDALFARHRIDLLFESARFFGRRLRIPALAWITDFQHRALPHLFPPVAYWRRELGFRAQVSSGRTIMLSSEDSRRACERYYPDSVGRTSTVQFAVPARSSPDPSEARRTAERYGLPNQFFYMPNQFWRHKNHLLVLQALASLRDRGFDIVVAASGKQADYRDQEHSRRVIQSAQSLQLQQHFRMLGHIPYADLLDLMIASSALLNPSLFEGWSTPVEEARSLGVPMVLSDLDVHKEQAGEQATYFDRSSASSLAEALRNFVPLDANLRAQMLLQAQADAYLRIQRYARQFAELAQRCAGSRGDA